jgi:crotonobetainyl-CoA:carnitine CoA-transferase CaiB-like acyl-CoA transferase
MPAALKGIRVLDMCIVLAGPTCGRALAEYGADVIKIDPEHRQPGLTPWLEVGRGKRSICLNVTKPAGLDAFYRLVETSDVVLEGFRKGVADRLGVGYEQLKLRKPGLIYVSINAFGQQGPWAMRPGFDQNAQAATGMQVRNGGRDGVPAPPPYTFNDYGTGLMAAYGVIMALLERERTGKGQRVETALSYTASTFSSPYMLDYVGYDRNEIEGPDAKGFNALSRLYQSSDSWFLLSVEDFEGWNRLTRLDSLKHLRGKPEFATAELRDENDEQLSEQLALTFRLNSTEEWARILKGVGVIAIPNQTISELREDSYAQRHSLIQSAEHPDFGRITHGGVSPQLSRTPAVAARSPAFGGDTESILRELGYASPEIDNMRASGAIPRTASVPIA